MAKRSTRVLVSIGIGYVAWLVCNQFMAPSAAIVVGVVVGGCTWGLTQLTGRAGPDDTSPPDGK
jgi:hypothetical protein